MVRWHALSGVLDAGTDRQPVRAPARQSRHSKLDATDLDPARWCAWQESNLLPLAPDARVVSDSDDPILILALAFTKSPSRLQLPADIPVALVRPASGRRGWFRR